MIATWMLAAMVLAAVLGGAAWALERALRVTGRQGRGPWMVALVASVAWPIVASLAERETAQSVTVRAFAATLPVAVAPVAAPEDLMTRVWSWLATLDTPLIALWIVATALLLGRVVWGVVALRHLARRAPRTTVDATEVRITDVVGPAVFALWRSELLLPSWLTDLDPRLQRLVMAHEREHVRAHDAQLIVASFVLVALSPWNLPLWWLAKRLRTAAELDCDARVLRAGADAHTYGQLLLLIAQRQGHARFLPMMAGAPSTLRDRIIAMSSPTPTRPALRAALYTAAAIACVAATASPLLARPLASVRLTETLSALLPHAATDVVTPEMMLPATAQQGSPQDSAKRALDATLAKKLQAAKTKGEADSIAVKEKKEAVKGYQQMKPAAAQKGYQEFKLDKPVVMASGSQAPRYPNELRKANVTGSVLAMFVVDTNGRADIPSLKIIRATRPEFVDAVKAALPGHMFLPAQVGDRKVRQLVQMAYQFNTVSHPERDSIALVKDVTALEIVITGNDKFQGNPTGSIVEKTITSAPQPTYFIDGKKSSADEMKQLGKDRIASVDVLKGETAIAKYGDDGKNGVVLITTKAAVAPLYIVDGVKMAEDVAGKLHKDRIASVNVLKGEAATSKYGDEGKHGVVVITLKH